MKRIAVLLFAVALPATNVAAAPQSAKEMRGASPYLELRDEPAPKLIVDSPLPDLVDATHQVFPGQAKTVTFTIPEGEAAHAH